jgi:hypothetical protein
LRHRLHCFEGKHIRVQPWIRQICQTRAFGRHFLKQLDQFAVHIRAYKGQPRNVCARARQARNDSSPTGIANAITMGIAVVLAWRLRGWRRFRYNDIDFKLNQLDSENGKSIQLFRSPSVRNANVLPLYVAQLPQGGFENFVQRSHSGTTREISNTMNFFLLLRLGYHSTSKLYRYYNQD